ncbi:MAG: DUF4363 family protein [Firmicutes bacterium]|nr:DUF4363 family protein [Bacillota bacterium]
MRSLTVSAAVFLILIVFWWFFMGYCEVSIAALTETIHTDLVENVRSGDWSAATASFDAFDLQWHDDKRTYSLFLTETAILEIDYSVARLKAYLECQNENDALAELSSISEQLKFLFLRERISLQNIF